MSENKTKQHGKVFFNLNFPKKTLNTFIRKQVEAGLVDLESSDLDDVIDQLVNAAVVRISEESVGSIKDILIDPKYKYINFKVTAYSSKPKNDNVEIQFDVEGESGFTMIADNEPEKIEDEIKGA